MFYNTLIFIGGIKHAAEDYELDDYEDESMFIENTEIDAIVKENIDMKQTYGSGGVSRDKMFKQ